MPLQELANTLKGKRIQISNLPLWIISWGYQGNFYCFLSPSSSSFLYFFSFSNCTHCEVWSKLSGKEIWWFFLLLFLLLPLKFHIGTISSLPQLSNFWANFSSNFSSSVPTGGLAFCSTERGNLSQCPPLYFSTVFFLIIWLFVSVSFYIFVYFFSQNKISQLLSP